MPVFHADNFNREGQSYFHTTFTHCSEGVFKNCKFLHCNFEQSLLTFENCSFDCCFFGQVDGSAKGCTFKDCESVLDVFNGFIKDTWNASRVAFLEVLGTSEMASLIPSTDNRYRFSDAKILAIWDSEGAKSVITYNGKDYYLGEIIPKGYLLKELTHDRS